MKNSISILLVLLLMTAGCAVQRGIDFGHWAKTAERIKLVKVFVPENAKKMTGQEQILFVPVMGNVPEGMMATINNSFYQEARNYLPSRTFTVSEDSTVGEYLSRKNLVGTGDMINSAEIARLGTIFSATDVLVIFVREMRPYPPQVLSFQLVMINTESAEIRLKMDGTFNANEQQVVLALADHMQSRRARKFDSQSLDVMLQSPTEFSSFVASYASHVLARELVGDKAFKNMTTLADSKGNTAL